MNPDEPRALGGQALRLPNEWLDLLERAKKDHDKLSPPSVRVCGSIAGDAFWLRYHPAYRRCKQIRDKYIAALFLALHHRILKTLADKLGLPDAFADLVIHCLAPTCYTHYGLERAASQWRFFPVQIAAVLQAHTKALNAARSEERAAARKKGQKRKRTHPRADTREASGHAEEPWFRNPHRAFYLGLVPTYPVQFAPFFAYYTAK